MGRHSNAGDLFIDVGGAGADLNNAGTKRLEESALIDVPGFLGASKGR